MLESLWKRGGKSKEKSRRISDITTAQRQDILAMRENGMLPSAIAEELDMDSGQVSRVIEMEKYRTTKAQAAAQPPLDPLKETQIEIARLKLEREKQEAQWALEDRQRDREQDLADSFGGEDDDEPGRDPFETMAMSFMMGLMSNKAQQGQVSSSSFPGPAAIETTATPTKQGPIDLTDEEIKATLAGYKAYTKQARIMPESVLRKIAAQRFSQFSEKTINRAIEMIKMGEA